MGEKLLKLWADSVITQSIITTVVLGTMCYLWVTGATVPNELYLLSGTVVGFYFGAKTQHNAQQLFNRRTGH